MTKYRAEHAGEEPPLTVSDRARLRELEKEVRELRLEKEFLGYADVRIMPMFPRSRWSGGNAAKLGVWAESCSVVAL